LSQNSQEDKQSWINYKTSKQPDLIDRICGPVELTTRCSSAVFLQEGKKSAELTCYLNKLGVDALINIKIMKLFRGKVEITGQNVKYTHHGYMLFTKPSGCVWQTKKNCKDNTCTHTQKQLGLTAKGQLSVVRQQIF